MRRCFKPACFRHFFEMSSFKAEFKARFLCQRILQTTHNKPEWIWVQSVGLQRRSMSSEPHQTVQEKMHEFLHNFYASQEHGILSIESACKQFCLMYRSLSVPEQSMFVCHLAEGYGVNQDMVASVAQQVLTSQEKGEAPMLRAEERLRSALIARYHVLFTHIGRIEGGVKFLSDLRADVLTSISTASTDLQRAHLQSLQSSLKELLSLWFTVGFLNLDRITWQSSCDMVQKISEYEAVHPIRHWADLKRRVGPYRRCFVFLHSSMPREPVVVLHTALTSEISSSIHSIIGNLPYPSSGDVSGNLAPPALSKQEEETENPNKITTAMFYSITSTQKGLQGVDLGNYLIKKVVAELQKEFPNMTQFSSVSPIPGFRDWLIGEINLHLHKKNSADQNINLPNLLNENEIVGLQTLATNDRESSLEILKRLINSHTWTNSAQVCEMLKEPLMRQCARYLYQEKRRRYALNPVANFHLQNGAVLWRINWMADMSLRGLSKSCGIMVNYRYYLEDTEQNSQTYIEKYIINTTPQIRNYCDQIKK